MYKLREGKQWEEVENLFEELPMFENNNYKQIKIEGDRKFNDYFVKVELPKVKLEDGFYGEFRIQETKLEKGSYWTVEHTRHMSVLVYVGESDWIKSIKEFNEKCSILFGFELED